jgi:uroporphyrin-III C-methyltransferase
MMTDQHTAEEESSTGRRLNWANVGIFFSTLAIVIFICAFGYGYFQLAKINVSLAQMITDLQKRTASMQDDTVGLQKSIDNLKSAAQKSQELSAQQEQLVSEWRSAQKGDLDKWHVAEAQYLVKLANDHVQFTHNISMALTLLQRADQVLANLQDPGLLDIRKSLAADIANLQVMSQIDVTNLYLRLTALNNQLDQLPLPINPLKTDTTQGDISTNPGSTNPGSTKSGLTWWQAGLDHSWQALKQIVVVRYNGSNTLPLVLPEEKIFLYQNLHAQMENAMWAVLHRNAEVYQASLARAMAWIQRYFAQEAPETKAMLQNLQELRKETIQPPVVNLSATLQLFDTYLAQSSQPKTAAQ